MSFIEENQHFINIELRSKMKNLSPSERNLRFKELYPEIIDRLITSYQKSEKKCIYYSEFFDIISPFDLDLIFKNIFFEENPIIVLRDLYSTRRISFDSVKNNSSIYHKFVYFFLTHKNTLINNSGDLVNKFIKQELFILNSALKGFDFSKSIDNDNSIIKNISVLFFQPEINDEDFIKIYLLFIKIWNSSSAFKTSFNKKAIIFYHCLVENLSKPTTTLEQKQTFLQKIQLITQIHNGLLNRDIFSPIISSETSFGSDGYIKKRNDFFSELEKTKKLLSVDEKLSYKQLICLINEDYTFEFIERIHHSIEKKKNNNEIPKKEDFLAISKLIKSKEGRKSYENLVFSFYRFELINS